MPIATTKSRKKRPSRRKAAARRPAIAIAETAPTAAVPAPKQPVRNAIYNGLVLLAALLTLSYLAGSVALPLFKVSDNRPERQVDDTLVRHEINRVLAEAGAAYQSPLLQGFTPAVETTTPANARLQNPARPRTRAERRAERAAAANASTAEQGAASAATSHELIAEARKYLGKNPTGRRSDWCGAFLDMVLRRTGHRGGGNLARGYINYGTRLPGPEVGAIAVFSRAGGGHVGIVTGIDANGNPIVISGNHNHRVAISTYPARRALAYVRPNG